MIGRFDLNTRRLALAAASALALTLAACSSSEPDSAPVNAEENSSFEEVINEDLPTVNEAPVVAEPANVVEATPTPTPEAVQDDRSADAQMYDDADATGMTARVDRSGDAGDANAPVEGDTKR
jgi:hypothetical protein